ncbi:hypothetical protein CHCC15325_3137 [Bacillus licheniformis]|nr:hypothetical protein CHCC15543_3039 [Bacillus licheniformis]TWL55469.1 hypothetical protein CHCC15325_3137 [Bacillus licheniformis]TWL77192.1 hypothetical protein CHCC15311_3845 [Bacillus licheniformis]TWM77841.1 hypothetical protein CHCC14808_1767 [Bacillus licheniformis]TWM83158.1 hypothetical protein CHCC14600_2254 [Bacillus licheniformis]
MNFDPEKFKKLLNSASNPSNPKDTKIKNYYVNQSLYLSILILRM